MAVLIRRFGAVAALAMLPLLLGGPATALVSTPRSTTGKTTVGIAPSSGPLGTVITISGYVAPADRGARGPTIVGFEYDKTINGATLENAAHGNAVIDSTGHLDLTVRFPTTGWNLNNMRTHAIAHPPVLGNYAVEWRCHVCVAGTFTLTNTSSLPFTGWPTIDVLGLGSLLTAAGALCLYAAGSRRQRASK